MDGRGGRTVGKEEKEEEESRRRICRLPPGCREEVPETLQPDQTGHGSIQEGEREAVSITVVIFVVIIVIANG